MGGSFGAPQLVTRGLAKLYGTMIRISTELKIYLVAQKAVGPAFPSTAIGIDSESLDSPKDL
jgi:hypothetical protein